MKPIEIIALTKLVKDSSASDKKFLKDTRAAVQPGVYEVDQLIHIKGQLVVGEDYPKAPTTTVLSKETLALVLAYAGITAQAAENALVAAFEDVIAENQGKAMGAVSASYKEAVEKGMKRVNAIIEKLPKVTCKGQVTGHIEYEAVEAVAQLKAVS